jgi:GNAT superfamily N-acetyltransferase
VPTTTALASPMPAGLRAHLASWAGGLPSTGMRVVAYAADAGPGWDGTPRRLTGLVDPTGRTVVAVPPGVAAEADHLLRHRAGRDPAASLQLLPGLVGRPGHTVERVAFRWCTQPASRTELPDAGVWVGSDSPVLPGWLRPFGGPALVALDVDGRYLAGVGIKRHDDFGHEISVGTEPQARGRGLARRLVAQAARHLLDQGLVPTYLHTFDNVASSRVAAAAGFPDLGWSALMLSDQPAAAAA